MKTPRERSTTQVECQLALTERQELIKTILECTSDAVITIEEHGTVTSINPAFQIMLGYNEQEAVGQKLNQFLSNHSSIDDLKKSCNQCTGAELTAIRKDGTTFPVDISISEMKFRGSPLIAATIHDTTEQNKLQRQLREQVLHLAELNSQLKDARDQAQEALILKSQFVANISHEIRTPMSGVLGMSELLMMAEIDEESHLIAEHIYLSAKGLLSIVNDILDFSKLEAGRVQLEKREFSVSAIVEQVVQSIRPAAAQKNIDVAARTDPSIPEKLYGDDGRIRQTLLNLAHNAIKFTEEGSVKIDVNAESSDSKIVNLRFKVQDTGIGIPEDVQHKLFLPFVQADNSTTRRFGGTGLGLSICKSLVTLMAGDLNLESEAGQGSTFSFVIPLAIASA